MEVRFRADGGARLGGGHLARCRAVAEAVVERGHTARLLCTPQTWAQMPAFHDAPWAVSEVGEGDPVALPPGPLLVDHYGLGAPWEATQAARGHAVVALEDGSRPHADGVAVVRPGASTGPHAGPGWLPLRPRILALRAARRGQPPGAPPRVVVLPGMVDGRDLAGHTLDALDALGRPLDVHVVVGAVARHLPALRRRLAGPGRSLHLDLPDPLPLLASADLGVGSAGVSAWERAALGLPSLAVAVVENQAAGAARLVSLGGAAWVGHARGGRLPPLEAPLAALLDSADARARASEAARAACDGQGAHRVAALLLGTPSGG